MNSSIRALRISAVFFFGLVLSVLLMPRYGYGQKSSKPLAKDEVISLLKSGVPADQVEGVVREHGISFELSSDTESELRNAGASESLIKTLRELSPKGPRPAEDTSTGGAPVLVIETTPGGGEVYIDDEPSGTTSAAGRMRLSKLPQGKHSVRVSLKGYRDFEQAVELTPGQTVIVKGNLEPVKPAAARGAGVSPSAGTVRQNPKDGLKYVWIPPGTFMMGCSPGDSECADYEKPAHQVTISKGFWIGQTDVTVDTYKRFARETGRGMPSAPSFNSVWTNGQMPITNVTWDDAQAYCTWAGARLPTEAEWEYAARGGSTEARYGPLDEIAWYEANSGSVAHGVAMKRANGFGLFDMLGNVWEWVSDWFDSDYYANSPAVHPSGPSSGQQRVLRGGSWSEGPRVVRVSFRVGYNPGDRGFNVGLRCVGEVANPLTGTLEPVKPASAQPSEAVTTTSATPVPTSEPSVTKVPVSYQHGFAGNGEGWMTIGNGMVQFERPKGKASIEFRLDEIRAVYRTGGEFWLEGVMIKLNSGKEYYISALDAKRKRYGEEEAQVSLSQAINRARGLKGNLEPVKPAAAQPSEAVSSTPATPGPTSKPSVTRVPVMYFHGFLGINKGWLTIGNGMVQFQDRNGKGKDSFEFRLDEIRAVYRIDTSVHGVQILLNSGKKYDLNAEDATGEIGQEEPQVSLIQAIERARGLN